MNAKTNQGGGPAFPSGDGENCSGPHHHVGMTLRDWFAGQALCGLLAQGSTEETEASAYDIADQMLLRRQHKYE